MGSNNYNKLKEQFANKNILIVGLGVLGGGIGLAKFFAELGASVTVTDKKNKKQLSYALEQLKGSPIKYFLGAHPQEIFFNTDLIFKGPFVPWDLPQIVAAQKKRYFG